MCFTIRGRDAPMALGNDPSGNRPLRTRSTTRRAPAAHRENGQAPRRPMPTQRRPRQTCPTWRADEQRGPDLHEGPRARRPRRPDDTVRTPRMVPSGCVDKCLWGSRMRAGHWAIERCSEDGVGGAFLEDVWRRIAARTASK